MKFCPNFTNRSKNLRSRQDFMKLCKILRKFQNSVKCSRFSKLFSTLFRLFSCLLTPDPPPSAPAIRARPSRPGDLRGATADLSQIFWQNRPRRVGGVRWNKQAFSQKICQNFVKFSKIFYKIENSRSSGNSLQFPEIPAKFHEIWGEKCSIYWKIRKILQKFGKFNEKLQNNAKIRNGAVQRCDNPVDLEKMLKNAPSLAIRNVDTEENGPRQVSWTVRLASRDLGSIAALLMIECESMLVSRMRIHVTHFFMSNI